MKLIVTGASGALGSATANLLHSEGHEVARLVFDTAASEPAGSFICKELADPEASAQIVGQAAEYLGGLDGVLHLAGAFDWKLT